MEGQDQRGLRTSGNKTLYFLPVSFVNWVVAVSIKI